MIDCLNILYPSFDFPFLFNQSSGHVKVREDGLLITNMNLSFGGISSSNMRDTQIEDISEFPSALDIGSV